MAERKEGKATRRPRTQKETTGSRPVRGGLAQKVKPDKQLAAVIGEEEGSRAEITKRIWEYIRSNDLQDPNDRRQINADAKLKKVFDGKDRVSMFEMTKLVNQHVQS